MTPCPENIHHQLEGWLTYNVGLGLAVVSLLELSAAVGLQVGCHLGGHCD